MSNIPDKCSRCGAPISWEEGAIVIKCEFCGYKNNLKTDKYFKHSAISLRSKARNICNMPNNNF